MKSSDYKQLIVWHKSMDLVVEVYSLVKLLPKEELYALSDQMRRAVVSIPSNISEGLGRNSDKEFIQFLSVSRGSLWELATQIEVCEIKVNNSGKDPFPRLLRKSKLPKVPRMVYCPGLISREEEYYTRLKTKD